MKTVQPPLPELPRRAAEKLEESRKFFRKLKKRTPRHLDKLVQELHDSEFERTDCLSCANCCKTTSPIFTDRDVNRIAKHLKMKEKDFIAAYLFLDVDGHLALRSTPCSFLDPEDNTCHIYEFRPRACRDYPHTDRRRFIQIADLTLKNTSICPAAFNIVEALKKAIPV